MRSLQQKYQHLFSGCLAIRSLQQKYRHLFNGCFAMRFNTFQSAKVSITVQWMSCNVFQHVPFSKSTNNCSMDVLQYTLRSFPFNKSTNCCSRVVSNTVYFIPLTKVTTAVDGGIYNALHSFHEGTGSISVVVLQPFPSTKAPRAVTLPSQKSSTAVRGLTCDTSHPFHSITPVPTAVQGVVSCNTWQYVTFPSLSIGTSSFSRIFVLQYVTVRYIAFPSTKIPTAVQGFLSCNTWQFVTFPPLSI